MFSLSRIVVMTCTLLTFVALTNCQSTTGKTVGQTISDASISTAVQMKLTSDRLSNFPRIDVNTERGVVNLSGVVETETQRVQAAYLAYKVKGVVKVNNNLQIQNRPPASKTSHATQSDDMKPSHAERHMGAVTQQEKGLREQGVRLIQGEVLRVEGDNYFVKRQDGKEVGFRADTTTMKTEKIKSGDRIEAKVDNNNHAISLIPAP